MLSMPLAMNGAQNANNSSKQAVHAWAPMDPTHNNHHHHHNNNNNNSHTSVTASDLTLESVNPWDIALCVTGTVVSCENALVVAVIAYTPSLRAPMFYLICSLAMADLLGGLGLVLNFAFLYLMDLPLARLISAAVLIASFSASVCSLLAITVDRYLSLYNALTYHTERTTTFTSLLLVAIWLTCLTLGSLPVAGWNCLADRTSCSVLRPVSRNNAAALSIAFLLVFGFMLHLYLQICRIASRHAQQIAVQYHFVATSVPSTRKGVSTLSLILGTFALCWVPLAVYCLVADATYPAIYTYITVLPAACNSLLNPVIYAFRNPDIQKSLWLICCGCFPSNFSFRARSSSDV